MKTKIFLLITFIILFFSCQKEERDNPFDPESPKEIWTPTNFQATQDGNTIKLIWSNPSSNISGFRITKKINNGNIVKLNDLPKNVNQYIDSDIIGGKMHTYSISAFAGNIESYQVNDEIIPIIQAFISTISPSLIGTKSITLNGLITSNGGSSITERGFSWDTNANPTTSNNKVINMSGLDNFSEIVTGLTPNTTYFVRAYAINSKGISYGNEISFTTKGYGSVTDIDNNVYNTITIGSQVWMVENLKTTKYKDGVSIPNVTSSWFNLQSGAYCWYNNNPASFKNIYGALYNGYAVTTGKLAPQGWHVPTDSEWSILINYLGGRLVASSKLREAGISHWATPNTGATNESGFTALPGGLKLYAGGAGGIDFYDINTWGYWWSSTMFGSTNVKYRSLAYSGAFNGEEDGSANFIRNGFSVRCIKD
jgi:uncharacterized protein (TIGR02145 family)